MSMVGGALSTVVVCLLLAPAVAAQSRFGREKDRPDVSQRASAMQVIGTDTEITITYHRPGVKGRMVWKNGGRFNEAGVIVPYDGIPRPWRAGANETTSITFEDDVLFEGQSIPAGTYGLFVIPTDADWTVILNRQWQGWGSFTYDQAQDVARVRVRPEEAEHEEWLRYGFDQLQPYSVRAFLRWGKKRIPFRISVEEKR